MTTEIKPYCDDRDNACITGSKDISSKHTCMCTSGLCIIYFILILVNCQLK